MTATWILEEVSKYNVACLGVCFCASRARGQWCENERKREEKRENRILGVTLVWIPPKSASVVDSESPIPPSFKKGMIAGPKKEWRVELHIANSSCSDCICRAGGAGESGESGKPGERET